MSRDGTVAYRAGLTRRQLVWRDRTGTPAGVVGTLDTNDLTGPALSPDGGRVAVTRSVQNNRGIWILDLLRGGSSPFTLEAETEIHPVWSPDGSNIAFESSRQDWKMRVKPSTGVGTDKVLFDEPGLRKATPFVVTPAEELNAQFAPNGRWIAYETNESGQSQIVVQSFPTQTRTWPISINGGVQPGGAPTAKSCILSRLTER